MKREPEIGDVISFHSDKMKFVVEKTHIIKDSVFGGGGIGDNSPIIYRHIWARELGILKEKNNEIWKYNSKGIIINFPTGGFSNNVINPKKLKF